MKGRILDRLVAAEREHRSVALATDLATGGQLLLDGDDVDGDGRLLVEALEQAAVVMNAGSENHTPGSSLRQASAETPPSAMGISTDSPERETNRTTEPRHICRW